MHARCNFIFNGHFVARLMPSVPVKKKKNRSIYEKIQVFFVAQPVVCDVKHCMVES